jgi:hypothetical protein
MPSANGLRPERQGPGEGARAVMPPNFPDGRSDAARLRRRRRARSPDRAPGAASPSRPVDRKSSPCGIATGHSREPSFGASMTAVRANDWRRPGSLAARQLSLSVPDRSEPEPGYSRLEFWIRDRSRCRRCRLPADARKFAATKRPSPAICARRIPDSAFSARKSASATPAASMTSRGARLVATTSIARTSPCVGATVAVRLQFAFSPLEESENSRPPSAGARVEY